MRDESNNSIYVGVEFEDDSSYTIIVRIPNDLFEEMLQEKTNFLIPGTPMIVVKKWTKKIVPKAIKTYAEGEVY